SPPAKAGGGEGGGMQQDRFDLHKGTCAHTPPLPNPPPQAGEGADRVRRSRRVHSARECRYRRRDSQDLAAWHAARLRNFVLTRSRRGRDRRRPKPCPFPPSSSARP